MRAADPSMLAPSRPLLAQEAGLSVWVVAFLVALLFPVDLFVGEIRLSVYRIVLLITLGPALARYLRLAAQSRIHGAEVLVALFALTGAFSLFMTGATVPALGGFFLDTIGPYVLGRAFIRTSAQFFQAMRVLVWCIIGLLPFAIYESLTTDPILITLLGHVFHVLPNVPHEARLGLDRAQVVFDHPILFGIFASMGFSAAIYATSTAQPPRRTFLKGALVALATFFSLSSGAFVSIGVQMLLVAYDTIFRSVRRRWVVLLVGGGLALAALELASDRTLAQLSIQFVALNPGTAWTRLNVNDWAMATIGANFWFGIGFNPPPPTPFWIPTTSIDNFWLAIGFRHGAPTLVLLLAAVGLTGLAVARTAQHDPAAQACKTAFLITLTGICVAVTTVHLWNATYCAFLFLLGAGLWLATGQDPPKAAAPAAPPRYSRDFGPIRQRRRPIAAPGGAE